MTDKRLTNLARYSIYWKWHC